MGPFSHVIWTALRILRNQAGFQRKIWLSLLIFNILYETVICKYLVWTYDLVVVYHVYWVGNISEIEYYCIASYAIRFQSQMNCVPTFLGTKMVQVIHFSGTKLFGHQIGWVPNRSRTKSIGMPNYFDGKLGTVKSLRYYISYAIVLFNCIVFEETTIKKN